MNFQSILTAFKTILRDEMQKMRLFGGHRRSCSIRFFKTREDLMPVVSISDPIHEN